MDTNIEGDKSLLQQYQVDIERIQQLLDDNEKVSQHYKKQIKVANGIQGLGIMGIFGSLTALAILIGSSQIFLPILFLLASAMVAVVSGVAKYNNKELLSLIDRHNQEEVAKKEYLECEVEKLDKKIKQAEKNSNKDKKVEKVQTFLLYTQKPKQLAEQGSEENLEEDTIPQENYVS